MPTPILYRGYEIQIEAFQQASGLSKGLWGSTFRIRKEDADISVSVVAAAREKTLERAELKGRKRATIMIDERLNPCVHVSPARDPHPTTVHTGPTPNGAVFHSG